MIKFQIGDHVRVIGLPNSEWDGISGAVVKTIERSGDDHSGEVQECAVQFNSNRRWFLAKDLVRAVPNKELRFFRGELLQRWADLSADDIGGLNGTREELVSFLQERYGFGLKRAKLETDDFFSYLEKRLHASTELSTHQTKDPKSSAVFRISA